MNNMDNYYNTIIEIFLQRTGTHRISIMLLCGYSFSIMLYSLVICFTFSLYVFPNAMVVFMIFFHHII